MICMKHEFFCWSLVQESVTDGVCIASQAAAIISKLQITDSQLGNVEQTILIVADTVCLVFFFILDEAPCLNHILCQAVVTECHLSTEDTLSFH